MEKKVASNICIILLIGSLTGGMIFPVQTDASSSNLKITVNSEFKAVTTQSTTYKAIDWAKYRGIINGYTDGTFKPNNAITEAQFVKMLSQFLGLKDGQGDLNKYTLESHWADEYYDSLAAYGTPVNGYFDNTLRNTPVKRGVVAQALGHLTGNATSLGEAIDFMASLEIEGNDLNHFFTTTNELTRAQVAALLYRMYNEGIEGAAGRAVEVSKNQEVLSLVELANKGMGTLDRSLRLGKLGSEIPTNGIVKEAYIPIQTLLQEPELPNGCEIVSLTAILNYYGYNVSKVIMADYHLPKQGFSRIDGKLFGPDPYKTYAGSPRVKSSGWYSFAPPIVEASNNYMATQQNKMKATKGIPIVTWVTLGEYYKAYTNLHVVVLNGYKEGVVHVMNPLKGQVDYNMDAFFNSYEEMGKHAVVLVQEEGI